MSQESAFLGADTLLGKIWTKKRYFDYLISKDNLHLIAGKSLQKLVIIDPAIEQGIYHAREDEAADTESCDLLLRQLTDLKAEQTIYITSCEITDPQADETAGVIAESDCVYVQNRLRLHREVNRQFGRVLNIYLPELALADPAHSPLLHSCVNPPAGRAKLPFDPLEQHQFYFPERIFADAERCIPIGIAHLIPAMPPLSTEEVIDMLAPKLRSRLRSLSDEERQLAKPTGSRRSSMHSFHWLDPRSGYLVSEDDQRELLKFYFLP